MNRNVLIIELAKRIRKVVRQNLGSLESREITNISFSGDVTFMIDKLAENVLKRYIKHNNLEIAYFSEDQGLIESGTPELLLIVDPIDGTRGAKHGFESCVISIALADYNKNACINDVTHACIYEIKSDMMFYAEKDKGTHIFVGKLKSSPVPTTNTKLKNLSWSLELMARPTTPTLRIIGPLVDKSSFRGGVFVFNSVCYSITRVVSGQLDAYIDVGNRILRSFPQTRSLFTKVANGRVFGLFPHDLAASTLIAKEAGIIITDGYGRDLGNIHLLDCSEKNQTSCIVANNLDLHQKIMEYIETKFKTIRGELLL